MDLRMALNAVLAFSVEPRLDTLNAEEEALLFIPMLVVGLFRPALYNSLASDWFSLVLGVIKWEFLALSLPEFLINAFSSLS